jgi:hypothetical protein
VTRPTPASSPRGAPPRAPAGGYAGAPLARKLAIAPGDVVALVHAPRDFTVPGLPDGARLRRGLRSGADVVLVFVRRAAELDGVVREVVAVLGPEDAVWVLWPRRAAGHDSDVTEHVVRAALLPTGLVDVKVAAVGEDFSGFRFVWRKERRAEVAARQPAPRPRQGQDADATVLPGVRQYAESRSENDVGS